MDPRALRPWTFQIDAYGAAAVAFGVLCGADFELPVGSARAPDGRESRQLAGPFVAGFGFLSGIIRQDCPQRWTRRSTVDGMMDLYGS